MAQQVVVPLAGHPTDELEAAALISLLRREAFDLRCRMFVAYVVEFGGRRDDAFAASQEVSDLDWDSAMYGDASGWVLRLSRTRRLTRESVLEDLAEVKLLAERFHGHVRAVTVEDLRHDDVWGELASRLVGSSRRREDETAAAAEIPVPRAGLPGRVDL